MPIITQLGVARQTTLMADRCIGAARDAWALAPGPGRDERVRDAKLFREEIRCWIEFAGRKHWHTVVRHGMAQYERASGVMDLLPSA